MAKVGENVRVGQGNTGEHVFDRLIVKLEGVLMGWAAGRVVKNPVCVWVPNGEFEESFGQVSQGHAVDVGVLEGYLDESALPERGSDAHRAVGFFCGAFEERDAQADFASCPTGVEGVGDFADGFCIHAAAVVLDAGGQPVGGEVFADGNDDGFGASGNAVFGKVEQVEGDFSHIARVGRVSAFKKLFDEGREFVGLNMADDFIIDSNDGGLRTGTNAAADFHGQVAISGGFADFCASDLFRFFHELGDASNVAGGAHAKFHSVFTAGFGGEEGVEGDDSMNCANGYAQFLGNVFLHGGRDVADFSLGFIENDHHGTGTVLVFGDDLVDNGSFVFANFLCLLYACWIVHVE